MNPPTTGTTGRTATVTFWLALLTPLEAVTVNESVVAMPALRRCTAVGV